MENRQQKLLNRAVAGAELCFRTRLDKAGGREPKEAVGAIQMSWHQDTERKKEESRLEDSDIINRESELHNQVWGQR